LRPSAIVLGDMIYLENYLRAHTSFGQLVYSRLNTGVSTPEIHKSLEFSIHGERLKLYDLSSSFHLDWSFMVVRVP